MIEEDNDVLIERSIADTGQPVTTVEATTHLNSADADMSSQSIYTQLIKVLFFSTGPTRQ